MALSEAPATTTPSEKKPDSRQQEKKEKPSTKVIIRRLPPFIDKQTFLEQVSPIPEYNYMYLVNGDMSLGENAFARAYINFICHEDVYNFKERFDNYVFLDQKGQEYPAVVEFAAFQKIPKKRGKIRVDTKCNTIETDPVYQEFLANIDKPEEQDEKPEYTLQLSAEVGEVTTTPLLEYIKTKRAQKLKFREVRREERKRRDMERKKNIEERKRQEDKPSAKPKSTKLQQDTEKPEKLPTVDEKPERTFDKPGYYKNKDRKFEEKKKDKAKFAPKKEFQEKRNFKRFEERNSSTKPEEPKAFPKKVKKYSERREERKMEAQKKLEQQTKESKGETTGGDAKVDEGKVVVKNVEKVVEKKEAKCNEEGASTSSSKGETTNAKTDGGEKWQGSSSSQKRIRNKDRPTMTIYRPGMLSKRKQNDGESEGKESK